MLMGSVKAQSQVLLPEANLALTLPATYSTFDRQVQGERLLYLSKRSPIQDKTGRSVIPNVAFQLEEIPASVSLKEFSAELLDGLTTGESPDVRTPRVVDSYRPGEKDGLIPDKRMQGYKLQYFDAGSVEHTAYVVYLVHNNVGVQAIFDSTTDVFAQCEPEFRAIIKSITIIP
ncbi:hypothetical protein CLV45_2272 [Hymenobacter chitinivorans DSM 11115]|uniref:PsbP protein n=2 Tax=Hymenobacter chitinivorans TaxID=89969 RepID=A0A2M9BSA4_9BACT|nr:hypothetical protein CLV45_2272 [Hymenobacter chitinivorans DSM 11115]